MIYVDDGSCDLACHQECPIGLSLRSTYPWTDAKMAGDGRVRLRKHHFSGVLAWWPGSAGISSVVANNMAICRPTFGGGISHHQMWVHPRPLWITMGFGEQFEVSYRAQGEVGGSGVMARATAFAPLRALDTPAVLPSEISALTWLTDRCL